jgi:hypothetical protein
LLPDCINQAIFNLLQDAPTGAFLFVVLIEEVVLVAGNTFNAKM